MRLTRPGARTTRGRFLHAAPRAASRRCSSVGTARIIPDRGYTPRMEETWRRFAGHGAEIYDDVEDVSGRVADYLVSGFAQREPALVVATPQHWRSFAVALSARGWLQEDVDRSAQVSPLADVCRLHSHVRPSQDPERLGRAVDAALKDVLGNAQAAKVYAVAAPSSERAGVPVSQLALSWITSHMPNLAELVLARARAHYEATV